MIRHNELFFSFRAATKRQFSIGAFIFLGLLFLCGCRSPWIVEQQANPNPFLGAKKFALQSVTFTNLQVGRIAESTYLKRKNEQQQQSWQADQEALADLFTMQLKHRLAGAGVVLSAQAPFTISPRVARIEPGSYINPTEVDVSVRLLDSNGNTLDEVTLFEMVPFDFLVGASSGQRIRIAAPVLANDFASYLRKRMKN